MASPIQVAQAIQVQNMLNLAAAQAAAANARGDTAAANAVVNYANAAAGNAAATSAALAKKDTRPSGGGLFSDKNLTTGGIAAAGILTGGGSLLPSLGSGLFESFGSLFGGANLGDSLMKVGAKLPTSVLDGPVKSAVGSVTQSVGNLAGEVISAPVKLTGGAIYGGGLALPALGAAGGLFGGINSLLNTGKSVLSAFSSPSSGGTGASTVTPVDPSGLPLFAHESRGGSSAESRPLAEAAPGGIPPIYAVAAVAAAGVIAYFLFRK